MLQENRFDSRLFELIPHRPPMLLINQVVQVSDASSVARVIVDDESPFSEQGKGVPAWIGLEYMGQTAALIAGYQRESGKVGPHLGFLLGTRAYKSTCDYFPHGTYVVRCEEAALVGDGLATFDCIIENEPLDGSEKQCIAKASLSVFRRPV